MTVTTAIRQAIEQTDATRRHISKASGVEEATISRFMTGKRGLDGTSIDALAKHFKLELRPAARKRKAR